MVEKISMGKLIDQVIAIQFAKTLKQEGFRRRYRTWLRVNEQVIDVVNVEASFANTRKQGNFRIKLGVYLPAAQTAPGLTGNINRLKVTQCNIQTKLGILMSGSDLWWQVSGDADLTEISEEVVKAWRAFGQAWLEQRNTLEKVMNQAIKEQNSQLAYEVSFAMGNREDAQHWLTTHLEKHRYRYRYRPGLNWNIISHAKQHGFSIDKYFEE